MGVKDNNKGKKFCEKTITNKGTEPPEGLLLKDKGKVFCPKACFECGAPRCEDDKKARFKKGEVQIPKCKPLEKKPLRQVMKICDYKSTKKDIGYVKDFCRLSCDNCPTAYPTSSPTKSAQPTSVPSSFLCFDHATFQFPIGEDTHTCASFRDLSRKKIKFPPNIKKKKKKKKKKS